MTGWIPVTERLPQIPNFVAGERRYIRCIEVLAYGPECGIFVAYCSDSGHFSL